MSDESSWTSCSEKHTIGHQKLEMGWTTLFKWMTVRMGYLVNRVEGGICKGILLYCTLGSVSRSNSSLDRVGVWWVWGG